MCIRLNHIQPTDDDPPMPTKNDAEKVNDVKNPANILTEKTSQNDNIPNENYQQNIVNNSNEMKAIFSQ